MGCSASTAVEASINKKAVRVAEGSSSSFLSKYTISTLLRNGEFAQIYSCKQKKTNQEMAVKVLKLDTEKEQEMVKQEEAMWKCLGKHENILTLVESVTENQLQHFVMELCEASLYNLSRSRPERCTEFGFLNTFHQVLKGLHHCHSNNIVHMDVKPANILLDKKGTVKLCDFGISVLLPKEGLTGISGTAPFMSPEMVQSRSYGFKTDIWSCGASAYQILYGEYPHQCPNAKDRQQVMEAIALGNPKPRWEPKRGYPEPSTRMRSFVHAMLQRNAKKRPSVEECLQLEVLQFLNNADTTILIASISHPIASISEELPESELKSEDMPISGCSTNCSGLSGSGSSNSMD
jgi:serine/threonine protein kinase